MLRPFVNQDAILGHVASRGDRSPRDPNKPPDAAAVNGSEQQLDVPPRRSLHKEFSRVGGGSELNISAGANWPIRARGRSARAAAGSRAASSSSANSPSARASGRRRGISD